MIIANIAMAKNELSRLLRRVKRGERVIITERNRPVAQLGPIDPTASGADEAGLNALREAGLLTPPTGPALDLEAFFSSAAPALPKGRGLVASILAEREEGR